ncbi:MAG TPA: VWA domain-containing protein [Candidatus Acidoferrales bacterium]|nr:VWA domain-containing protein [Candidatus Acidoferrales bacterium]
MRLTPVAASMLILGLAGYAALSAFAPRASAVPQSTAGPMRPPGSAAPSQDAAKPPQDQPPAQSSQTIRTQTNLVNVFVTARDKHNGIISDLGKDDFKVLEDGQDQKVAYFAKESDMPITLGILIDTSGSMQNILDAEQDTASRFVHQIMRKKDEAMIISFDFDINLLADFTEDPSVLERAIRRTQINAVSSGGVVTPSTVPTGSNGGTDLYDAVYLACHDQFGSEAGRRAIILLTDAEDTGSKLTLQQAIEAAQRSDAVIHVLRLSDEPFYMSLGMGYSGAAVARKMAEDTGGREVEVRGQKSLEKAFDEISEELRSQYVIGYYPTNDKRDGTFRKIRVDVNRSDVRVLARKGYYAPR